MNDQTKLESVASDMVNHPSHYNVIDRRGVHHECLDVVQALELNFNSGNAFKYLWRAGKKNKEKTIEDLKKAVFYISEEINTLEASK